MTVETAVTCRRSARAFRQDPIDPKLLRDICNTARLYASGGNRQPIRLRILEGQALCDQIFPLTRWAAYLPDYTIAPDQRPTAYVLIAADSQVSPDPQFDAGAMATSILLLAEEKGLGSCCIGSFNRKEAASLLGIDQDRYPLLYLVALGYTDQVSRIEDLQDTVRYRWEDGGFTVPKYSLSQILI